MTDYTHLDALRRSEFVLRAWAIERAGGDADRAREILHFMQQSCDAPKEIPQARHE